MRMVKELDEEEIVDEMDESEERKKEGVEFVEIDKDKVREGWERIDEKGINEVKIV